VCRGLQLILVSGKYGVALGSSAKFVACTVAAAAALLVWNCILKAACISRCAEPTGVGISSGGSPRSHTVL
jgi:hypothetical protein